MTGARVRAVRVALGLDPARFSQLLGVHSSTVYRWEAAGESAPRIEPLQRQILAVAEQVSSREGAGSSVLDGLLLGGPMLGLYRLLEFAYGETRQSGPR